MIPTLSFWLTSFLVTAFDDSDDDSASIANNSTSNPLSPGSSSYRSRFRFGSSSTAASTAPVEPTDRFGVSSSSARRISRSGYTYRTRVSSREPSPEEEAAGMCAKALALVKGLTAFAL